MEKYVFYRAGELAPEIDVKEQTLIPLEDKDFMIFEMLNRYLDIIKRQGMK